MQSMNTKPKPNFKLAGDIDFVSFLFCRISTILPQSTSIWLAPHSIEKYLKAIIENREHKIVKGHNLVILWKKVKDYIPKDHNIDIFEDMIINLNSITTDARYLQQGMFTSMFDTANYILLATRLRYLIINDKEEYKKLDYGLSKDIIVMPNKNKELIDFLDLHFKKYTTYSPMFGEIKPLQFDKTLAQLYFDYPWLVSK